MRIAGMILAGGAGRRLGGTDKALLPLAGRPLLAHVVACLAPQVAALALSANGDAARFAEYGLPVLADASDRVGEGPLAGILAGLDWAAGLGAERLLVSAVDTPFLPADLAARLGAAPGAAYAACAGRDHPSIALWPVAGRARLAALFATGERRLRAALAGAERVEFDGPEHFFNINTPDDLAAAEAFLAGRAS
ncbi:MAG: molybdenum cofactor guanylyltransferase MobA [Phaeovulum sp.]|uniref:molybdenum cofactor guanylyltransferase MobA n=1 Tax=Phaeovulum sp. TaxID=2934796 RepID=UPI002735E3E0|nr:molybdenum cofactor guanylyltransferase MobA [Phaeovulum sp.]MDP3860861.1 molybdenum cofactor guanylyltransferase MobA [Phaeovulum sp.]